eukprot:CAMPEP_0169480600 /NCGR_PEP_ID=MMETSP1042-20121227/29657_1 /TAXON_ID=464988 /ORGANISM="Hemiselmis andersenii, Strain CCMP1180" /LENGTH=352 /DNA_ID=CAMNT_0009595269 /DNA_START=49 /DNA_END=1108 /DNA_ORIENTATION=-
MGGGASKVPPSNDAALGVPGEPEGFGGLQLWAEHSKGKLLGRLNKKGSVPIGAFVAEGDKGMESFAWFMRMMVGGATCTDKVVDANTVLEAAGGQGRASALCPTYTYNNSNLKVIVTRPKGAPKGGKLPALVWAHGGGIATTAKNWDWCGKAWAKALGAVVLNVDFRHGGLAEAPAGAMDLVAVVKWVHVNADELGVLPERVSVAGQSGGGFEASVACLELAARGEAGLVRAAFMDVPLMWPTEMLGPYDGMSEWRRFEHEVVCKQIYMCYAGPDWEARWGEGEKAPWLNILAAPDDLMAKSPKQVVLSVEFDICRWQVDAYAAKLQRCGALYPFDKNFLKVWKRAWVLYSG